MEQPTVSVTPARADQAEQSAGFYDDLPLTPEFVSLADSSAYRALPDNWVVLTTDVVSSRQEIAKGRYKTINMVGASVIAAMKNAVDQTRFPYVFGGDGASLALPDLYLDQMRDIAGRVRRWAQDEFEVDLRAGLARVSDIRAAGHTVTVARFATSDKADFAVFSGGGLKWLEGRLKSGANEIAMAAPGQHPDLSGLSCRWSNLKARNGHVVSLVIEPEGTAQDSGFFTIAKSVIQKIDAVPNAGNPIPKHGPDIAYPPPGMALEAHASRAGTPLWLRYMTLAVQNFLIWCLFRFGIRIGGFDPDRYTRQIGLNADHRKFEDGLKMTFDCDEATLDWIRTALDKAQQDGVIRYGLAVQSEAFLTCIVVSPQNGDHVHFVDGADGGYALAATAMA